MDGPSNERSQRTCSLKYDGYKAKNWPNLQVWLGQMALLLKRRLVFRRLDNFFFGAD
ncbi:Uncharacterised protein [Yersinia intermedia]|nr:Uncharacterised protein [Yersinia intermedia]